jgi:hypothetical protein
VPTTAAAEGDDGADTGASADARADSGTGAGAGANSSSEEKRESTAAVAKDHSDPAAEAKAQKSEEAE